MSTQPMTSAKRFAERYPEVVEAVSTHLTSAGLYPPEYVFTGASVREGILAGKFMPAEILSEYEKGNYLVPSYSWLAFAATVPDSGPVVEVSMEIISDGGWSAPPQ